MGATGCGKALILYGAVFGWLVPSPILLFQPIDRTQCLCDPSPVLGWFVAGFVFFLGCLVASNVTGRIERAIPSAVSSGAIVALFAVAASAHYVYLRDGHAHGEALILPERGVRSLARYWATSSVASILGVWGPSAAPPLLFGVLRRVNTSRFVVGMLAGAGVLALIGVVAPMASPLVLAAVQTAALPALESVARRWQRPR